MVFALGVILALYFFRHRDDGRKRKVPPEISAQKRRQNFIEQAQRLGFTRVEARILSQVAGNGEAEHSEKQLKKGPHFWHFAARVKKLARQRKNELAVLDEIVGKLTRIKKRNVQERKDLRSDIDLPVWLGSENEGQVEGQLVNISVGRGCDPRRHGFAARRSGRILVNGYPLATTDHGSGFARRRIGK